MAKQIQIFDLPFFSEDFKNAWNEWIEYRKARRLPKYVEIGLKKTFSKLLKDSGNNEHIAIEIIENSMANNWQGLIPLKNNNGHEIINGSDTKKSGTSDARIEKLRTWGA